MYVHLCFFRWFVDDGLTEFFSFSAFSLANLLTSQNQSTNSGISTHLCSIVFDAKTITIIWSSGAVSIGDVPAPICGR